MRTKCKYRLYKSAWSVVYFSTTSILLLLYTTYTVLPGSLLRGGGGETTAFPYTSTCVDFYSHTVQLYWKENNGFIRLPRSQNSCLKTCAYRKPCISHEWPDGRCEIQRRLLNVRPQYPTPPHLFTCLTCGEIYKYWVLRNNSSVALTWSCDKLIFTASSSSSSTISSPFFILLWERVSWPFFRLLQCMFLTRSLGFLESFSNSPLSSFGHLMAS